MSYKPVRQFSANEGDWSVDERGPDAIEHDLDVINRMFDPTAEHENGQKGGISFENLNFKFSDESFAARIGNSILPYIGNSKTIAGQLLAIANYLKRLDDNKQNNLTFDSAPTKGSQNPVTSNGIKQAIDNSSYLMTFYINENGHLIFEKTDGVAVDFNINNNGHLFVEVN